MSFETVFLLFLTFLPVKPDVRFFRTCNLHKVDYWKLYYWMFQSADHKFISTYEIENDSRLLERYLNEILLSVAAHGLLKKSFTINNYILKQEHMTVPNNYCQESSNWTTLSYEVLSKEEGERRRLHRICQEDKFMYFSCPNKNVSGPVQYVTLQEILELVEKVKANNESELQRRMRSFSSDTNYRYMILVQNEEDLLQHLEHNWRKVFPNPRGIYVLIFISVDEIPPKRLEELFKTFWLDYNVFNLIINQPCVCNYKQLHTYDPFHKKDNDWGLLKSFKVDDVIDDPGKFKRTLLNLNGYPLRISLFSRIPTAVNQFPKVLQENPIYGSLDLSLGYIGMDGMVVKGLAKALDLTPQIGTHDFDYGYEMNGKYYGILGEVANRSIDGAFNSRFADGIGLDVIEYLTPVMNDKFCIILPKALEVPQYLMIFQCFTWRSWLIIFFIYVVSSFYWYLVRPIEFRTKRMKRDGVMSILEVFCLFLAIPLKLLVEPNHQRVFFVSCMIFNIIIIGCFQGTLVKSFSTLTYYPDINTLEEFEKSGLYIISSSRGVQNVLGDDGSAFFRKLKEKIKIVPKLQNSFRRIATKRDMASIDRKADARLKIDMNYTRNKKKLIHIATDCPMSYHFTYIVPKGSPYIHVFNIIITVFRETGLLVKWHSDVVDAFINQAKYRNKDNWEDDRLDTPFGLEDMTIAFCVLIFGCCFALFVFLGEICVGCRCCKRAKKRRNVNKRK